MNKLNHVYEVYTVDNGEEVVVDVLRFDSQEDVSEFELGIVGDYKVRPISLSAEELVDVVLDFRDMLLEENCYLEDKVKELEAALHVARSYIEDIIPTMNATTKLKNNRGKSSKIYPFNGQKL